MRSMLYRMIGWLDDMEGDNAMRWPTGQPGYGFLNNASMATKMHHPSIPPNTTNTSPHTHPPTPSHPPPPPPSN